MSRSLTGSPWPAIPWQSMAILLGLVALLTGVATLAPTIRMIMRPADA